jgi:hypothetical protein
MTLYAGTNIDLKVRGSDAITRAVIADANCVINLYGPPSNPQLNPEQRPFPSQVVTATFDPVSRYYLATVNTTGWAPGTWWMQGVLSGGAGNYEAFDFACFTLCP